MAKRQREPVKDTLADKDEYHPDPRVAAAAADQQARKAARLALQGWLERAENAGESTEFYKRRIAQIEQDIKDNEPTTDPED